jgi:hypothetical protein
MAAAAAAAEVEAEGWTRRRGAALIRAAAPGWRRRSVGCTRVDAQGHFETTLLVTSREGQRQPPEVG